MLREDRRRWRRRWYRVRAVRFLAVRPVSGTNISARTHSESQFVYRQAHIYSVTQTNVLEHYLRSWRRNSTKIIWYLEARRLRGTGPRRCRNYWNSNLSIPTLESSSGTRKSVKNKKIYTYIYICTCITVQNQLIIVEKYRNRSEIQRLSISHDDTAQQGVGVERC